MEKHCECEPVVDDSACYDAAEQEVQARRVEAHDRTMRNGKTKRVGSHLRRTTLSKALDEVDKELETKAKLSEISKSRRRDKNGRFAKRRRGI